jgi:hypothetical protein
MNYEIKRVDVDSLVEFPDNPRTSNLDGIKESIKKHGQYRPLTVNKNNNQILTGNHTWLAMKELGIKQCSVMFVEVDDLTAKKIVLVDNRANELATYDKEIMVDLLTEFMELGKLLGTGYSADEVDDILAGFDEVNITDFEQFTGGYAMTEEELAEAETKLQTPSERTPKEKMNEIILALVDTDYQRYQNNIGVIQKGTGKTGTEALFTSVLNIAEDINKGKGDRPSIFNKMFGK